jgi:hypothetical protein
MNPVLLYELVVARQRALLSDAAQQRLGWQRPSVAIAARRHDLFTPIGLARLRRLASSPAKTSTLTGARV